MGDLTFFVLDLVRGLSLNFHDRLAVAVVDGDWAKQVRAFPRHPHVRLLVLREQRELWLAVFEDGEV